MDIIHAYSHFDLSVFSIDYSCHFMYNTLNSFKEHVPNEHAWKDW